jgi:hypothetical protein
MILIYASILSEAISLLVYTLGQSRNIIRGYKENLHNKNFKNFYISTANYPLIHAGNAYNRDHLKKRWLLDDGNIYVGRGASWR